MKYILSIITLFVCLSANSQTTYGGHALLDGGGELPVSYYKNCMTSNLTETADRTHNANKHFYVIERLDYYQLNAGVLAPMSFMVDSAAVSAQGDGQFTVDCEGGVFLRGGDGFTPAIKAYDDKIELNEPSGDVYIDSLDQSNTALNVVGWDIDSHKLYSRNAAVQWSHTPSGSGDTGIAGQLAWDGSFLYVCVATNTWTRIALTW